VPASGINAEKRAQKNIPAINERVLQSDIKDRNVFLDSQRASIWPQDQRHIDAAIILSGRAIFAGDGKAVPWSAGIYFLGARFSG